MKRKSFFKSLIGLAVAPMVPSFVHAAKSESLPYRFIPLEPGYKVVVNGKDGFRYKASGCGTGLVNILVRDGDLVYLEPDPQTRRNAQEGQEELK